MNTIGQEFINALIARGVDTIFGIPGVHTVELYRGLQGASIRHVTPRHEQGAGFMADGYARVAGRPGVAFVITGPGLTNTFTTMGQARADSTPILIVSSENPLSDLRQGKGLLHELPDQHALASLIALDSYQINSGQDLQPAIDKCFETLTAKRPGPVHIEIPLDITPQPFDAPALSHEMPAKPQPDSQSITTAIEWLKTAKTPVIIAGGGAKNSSPAIKMLAEKCDAPVVQTVNARGVLHHHPLSVPASPSLNAVKTLIEAADVVLALGTEFGQTDFDMYATNTMPQIKKLIRVDICSGQLTTTPDALAIHGDVDQVLASINVEISQERAEGDGALRAEKARVDAFDEIGDDMRNLSHFLDEIREASPNAIVVGDSAQPIYAGNLYYDHDRPGGWFNAATGFGALGYAIPASIGAAIADPDANVICLTGDGGAQFSLPELMVAVEQNLSITFVIYNNLGYQEISTSMQAVGVEPIGCDPKPPIFEDIAQAYGIPFQQCTSMKGSIQKAIKIAQQSTGPSMIEVLTDIDIVTDNS